MAIYRFKVIFEDNEEIFREIEIKSTQHFEDFHNAIIQSIGFDNLHNASFYISDDYWRKGEEIKLRQTDEVNIKNKAKEDQTQKKLMKACKMASLIDDPHQKFVYVYDPKSSWTLLIELLKIVSEDPKANYPKVAKIMGEFPKQYKTNAADVASSVEDEFIEEDSFHTDDDAYINAHSEDETALLEGEEGESIGDEMEEEVMDNDEDEFGSSEFEGHDENMDER
ncbi:MAG: hypothetical protein ABI315_07435 [Bacteroidia bacterium]